MLKTSLKFSYFLVCCTVFFSSCRKQELFEESAQYAVSVNYKAAIDTKNLMLDVFVNNVFNGEISLMPNVPPTYLDDCDELSRAQVITNTFIVKGVKKGLHNIELKSKNGNIVKKLVFEVVNQDCVLQECHLNQSDIQIK